MSTVAELVVNLKAETAAFTRQMKGVRDNTKRTADSLAGIQRSAKNMLTGFVGLATVTAGFRAWTAAVTENEQSQARLQSVLKATGHSAGLTVRQISDMADEMERSTLFDADEMRNAAAVMATFRSVQGDTFQEGIKLAADMSAVMGNDLQANVLQLGKALHDPVLGVTALRRAGVSFSAEQTKMISSLVATNDLLGAQKIVLDEVARQFGGAAAGQQTGLTGAINQAKDAWGEFLESLGKGPDGEGIGAIQYWVGEVEELLRLVTRETDPSKILQGRLNDYAAAFNTGKASPNVVSRMQEDSAALGQIKRLELAKERMAQHDAELAEIERQRALELARRLELERLAAEAAKKRGEEIAKIAKASRDEAATLGMSAAQIADYTLEQLGASAATRATVAEQHAQVTAFERQKEAFKEMHARLEAGADAWYRERDSIADSIAALKQQRDEIGKTATAVALMRLQVAGATEGELALAESILAQITVLDEQAAAVERWQQMAQTAVRGTQEAFADFFNRLGTDGMDSFRELLVGMVSAWKRAIAEMAAARLTQSLLGDGSFLGNLLKGAAGGVAGGAIPAGVIGTGVTPGFQFHEGGVVGQGGTPRSVSASMFVGAPRYHGGGIAGLRPDEVPAILQKGERVIPRGGGDGGLVINFAYTANVNAIDTQSGSAFLDRHGADVAQQVLKAVKQSRGFRAQLGGG